MVQASVLHAVRELRLVSTCKPLSVDSDSVKDERELAEPLHGEAQVQVTHVGLCGSDLHYYNHFANGSFKVREPLTLGHEAAGIVVKVGKDVSHLKIGDTVALEVGIPCNRCKLCTSGRYNLCSKLRFRSSAKSFPHFQGVLQERINHPAQWCHAIPKGMTGEQAALIEPLAVALHALRRSCISEEPRNVLVTGAGAVGLLVSLCLKARGHTVVVADISEPRLQFARQRDLAATTVLLPSRRGVSTEENLEIATTNQTTMCQSLAGLQKENIDDDDLPLFDLVFECTGVQSCVQAGIFSTTPGGKVVLVGMGQAVQTLQISAAALREVDLIGVFRYANNYKEAFAMYESGQLQGLESLVTHRTTGLASAPEAFALAGKTEDPDGNPILKVMISVQ